MCPVAPRRRGRSRRSTRADSSSPSSAALRPAPARSARQSVLQASGRRIAPPDQPGRRSLRSAARRTLPASSRRGASTNSTTRGSLYFASRSAANSKQLLLGERVGVGLDDRVDEVAQVLVGKPDHADRSHGRVLLDRGLDLGRVDVRPAREDHVLHAVAEVQVAVVVEPAHVAERLPAAVERARLGADVVVRRARRARRRSHTSPISPAGRSLPSASEIMNSPVLGPADRARGARATQAR